MIHVLLTVHFWKQGCGVRVLRLRGSHCTGASLITHIMLSADQLLSREGKTRACSTCALAMSCRQATSE